MKELLPTCSRVSNSLCSITRCSNESRSRGRDAAVRAAKVRSASSSDACSEVIWSLKLRVAFLLSSERKRGKHCHTVPLDKGHYDPNSFMAIVIDFNSHIMKSYEKQEYRQDTFLKSIFSRTWLIAIAMQKSVILECSFLSPFLQGCRLVIRCCGW